VSCVGIGMDKADCGSVMPGCEDPYYRRVLTPVSVSVGDAAIRRIITKAHVSFLKAGPVPVN
jgi:hypothetical protein